jgi:hypothetical protein
MRVYRVYDKQEKRFIKIGKRTNDIYVNKTMLVKNLKLYFNIDNFAERFTIYDYDLVLKKERD